MSDRFPYDVPSRQALVRLIQETYPRYGVTWDNVTFLEPYYSPTINTPGRTFVEMFIRGNETPIQFVYRRLDLAVALGSPINLTVDTTTVTPKSIALELNEARAMNFGPDDVSFSEVALAPEGEAVSYRLRALPGSYVWYGELIVNATPAGVTTTDARLLESGETRLTEDGSTRYLETA